LRRSTTPTPDHPSSHPTEGRIRIVYKKSINLSLAQYKAIQGLYNERNEYIWNNYRPTQPNTYMQVISSFKYGKKPINIIPTTTTAVPY
jgi:hypothetical protein